mgnify:CR=1 FL=1
MEEIKTRFRGGGWALFFSIGLLVGGVIGLAAFRVSLPRHERAITGEMPVMAGMKAVSSSEGAKGAGQAPAPDGKSEGDERLVTKLFGPLSARISMFLPEFNYFHVSKIVPDNLCSFLAAPGQFPGAPLAHTDSVAEPFSFEDHCISFYAGAGKKGGPHPGAIQCSCRKDYRPRGCAGWTSSWCYPMPCAN